MQRLGNRVFGICAQERKRVIRELINEARRKQHIRRLGKGSFLDSPLAKHKLAMASSEKYSIKMIRSLNWNVDAGILVLLF